MKSNLKKIGFSGEDYAIGLLKKSGYKIIKRNFRCSFGEIDIIATLGDILVFVEVKTRLSNKFGLPEEAVNPRKIGKITKVGEYFLKLNPNFPKKLRIDVVALQVDRGVVTSSKIIPVV